MPNPLKEFFAVTKESVYRVVICGEGCPYIEKIATKQKRSRFPVGTKVNNGSMLGISKLLLLYSPQGSTLEQVNSSGLGFGTKKIVALFLAKEEALSCFNQSDLSLRDKRWINETREVLEKVGNDHPYAKILRYPGYSLITA